MAKGGIADLLMGKPKEDDEEIESEEMADEDEVSKEGHLVAAEEILAAVESGDAEALVTALKSFVGQCDD